MKKIYIYIIISSLALFLLAVLYSTISSRQNSNQSTLLTPTPSIFSNKNVTPELNPTIIQEQKDQSQADKEFGQWTKDTYEKYPWYDQLPLRNQRYFVYFDIYQKKFIADIYLQSDQDRIKSEIVAKLNTLGIQTNQYQFVWNVK